MSKVLALYNNKGGVSKTTTLFNIGVYLSKKNKRVLIVDCDPQCNMTELFFASNEDAQNPDNDLPGTSIYKALLPRFIGETATIDQSRIDISNHSLYDNLYLFRGDIEFSRAETYFGTSWNQAITENIHEKNTYVVFNRLLKALGQARGYDYILCDVGPSTGAITRTVILSCDEIIVPLIPDRFCYQSVKLLGTIINEWIKRHRVISESLEPFGIETFEGNPYFSGAILQNFKIHSTAKTKKSYIEWQNRILDEIKLNLIGEGKLQSKLPLLHDEPYIASIRDVGALAPTSQIFGRAIFDLQQSDTESASSDGRMYYGSVWQQWKDRMLEYVVEMEKIYNAIK